MTDHLCSNRKIKRNENNQRVSFLNNLLIEKNGKGVKGEEFI